MPIIVYDLSYQRLLADTDSFKAKALAWADCFDHCCYLDNNHFKGFPEPMYECIIAAGTLKVYQPGKENPFDTLKQLATTGHWHFGFLTYDLKNNIESLTSANADQVGMPLFHFFAPEVLILVEGHRATIWHHGGAPEHVYQEILQMAPPSPVDLPAHLQLKSRVSQEDYLAKVRAVKEHIAEGDIYELNFCQEYYLDDIDLQPVSVFHQLNQSTRAPFAAYYKLKDRYLMCSSPERFLRKKGQQLLSQPIKGTIKRGVTPQEDEVLKKQLHQDVKERAENVMIVDLVRNDLARSAMPGSVKVEELFGIYSFPNYNHMISSISANLRPDVHVIDAIKHAFPMGSMTGAPKVMAMELIEQYEVTKRGLYAGCVGYLTPDGDLDLNVVIRSMLYNASNHYLSFQVGGAITYDSIPEKEYEECLLKAKGMMGVLGVKLSEISNL